ncbi:MAG: hypothetical protein ABI843_01980 [Dokdonella sp.]
MMLRLAKLTLLLSLFPLAGMAQTLPSLAPTSSEGRTPLVDELLALDSHGQPLLAQGAPVLPIWSGSNGQLLAVVALPREWATSPLSAAPAYGGPSEWHLAGSSAASASGLRWQFGDGLRAEAMLGQYLSAAPVACAADTCGSATASRWSHGSLTAALGMGWSTADGGLDLSYGLSWLQSQGTPTTLGSLASAGSALVPVLTLPSAQSFTLDSETSVYARGRWQLESGPAFDVAASYGRGKASAIGSIPNTFAPGIDLDQLSLSLGMDAGSLRGAIVGHVLSSDDPMLAGKHWTTLDLGVSWRTPWSGELSVGAQNLLSSPLNASSRDAESQQTRTPYIQYRQDL